MTGELVAMQVECEPLEESSDVEEPVAAPCKHLHAVVEALYKAALDTQGDHLVQWASTFRGLRYREFKFRGGVIIITNANLRSPHYQAFIDRVHYYDLQVTNEELIAKIQDVALKTEGVSPQIGTEVACWLIEHEHLLQENLSLRTFVKVAELAKGFPVGWQKLARITTFKPEDAMK